MNAVGWFSAGHLKALSRQKPCARSWRFEGFNSRITTNNGWNRVVIGPVKGKENADNTISRLKVAGHQTAFDSPLGLKPPKSPSILALRPHTVRACTMHL